MRRGKAFSAVLALLALVAASTPALALDRNASTNRFNWGDDLSETVESPGANQTPRTPSQLKPNHLPDIKTAIDMSVTACGVSSNVWSQSETQTVGQIGHPGSTIKASQINALRRAIENLYTAKGDPNIGNYFTGSVSPGQPITKRHINDMRRALDDLVVDCSSCRPNGHVRTIPNVPGCVEGSTFADPNCCSGFRERSCENPGGVGRAFDTCVDSCLPDGSSLPSMGVCQPPDNVYQSPLQDGTGRCCSGYITMRCAAYYEPWEITCTAGSCIPDGSECYTWFYQGVFVHGHQTTPPNDPAECAQGCCSGEYTMQQADPCWTVGPPPGGGMSQCWPMYQYRCAADSPSCLPAGGTFTFGGPAVMAEQCAGPPCCSGLAICSGNTGTCIAPDCLADGQLSYTQPWGSPDWMLFQRENLNCCSEVETCQYQTCHCGSGGPGGCEDAGYSWNRGGLPRYDDELLMDDRCCSGAAICYAGTTTCSCRGSGSGTCPPSTGIAPCSLVMVDPFTPCFVCTGTGSGNPPPPPSAVCGNGVVEAGEACDLGMAGNGACPRACSASCTTNSCGGGGAFCGDGLCNGIEDCLTCAGDCGDCGGCGGITP